MSETDRRAPTDPRVDALTQGPQPAHDPSNPVKIRVEELSFWYGAAQALFEIDLEIPQREVTAFIGPSGSGKSTLLRCLNRTNELTEGARTTGRVLMDGVDLYGGAIKPQHARRRFGWIAQKPNPFAFSVFENIAYGPRLHRQVSGAAATEALVERSLRRVGLWEEVKDRLKEPALALSGGEQQRLCIARALAYEPEVLLMDEPCSALDPVATDRIEALIEELREDRAIVMITHRLRSAARLAQRIAVLGQGRLVEQGDAAQIIEDPQRPETRAFLNGG